MITKYNFELALERVAEKFYFQGATQFGRVRGGNSADNEAYFRNVASDLRGILSCQQILLNKGTCPDSGIFGDFDYKNEEDISWGLVEAQEIVALEILGVNRQKRFIEVCVAELGDIPTRLTEGNIELALNDVNSYGEFFGVEYKATKNSSQNSITVASFNSSCPSMTKTALLKKVKMYHNFESRKKVTIMDTDLKVSEINLTISFSIYYLIVNDNPTGSVSEIKQIFVCDGGFFAPNMTEEEAKSLSTQLYPRDLNIPYDLYRVSLRFRPFFDSKTIKANGYGLYTSWEPKIPREEQVLRQRELLMNEVERVQQSYNDDNNQSLEITGSHENPDNVIYLTLREDRIKKRAA